MNEIEETLELVSQNCLRGQSVPRDLAALWLAQIDGDTELLDAYELTLFDYPDEELFAGFRAEDGVDEPVAEGFDRFVNEVCWFAQAMDGAILGYWVGDSAGLVENSPVVVCDEEGQFELGGRTLAEYLLDQTDPEDEEDFEEVAFSLGELGVLVEVQSHEDIWDHLEGFEDPNAVVMGYIIDAKLNAAQP